MALRKYQQTLMQVGLTPADTSHKETHHATPPHL